MATFYANPNDENEPWLEKQAFDELKLRVWHFLFFGVAGLLACMTFLACCFHKVRIPRTKQEIEADFHRKKLTRKFRRRLKLIENQEMNSIDLMRALEIIQEDQRKQHEKFVSNAVNVATSILPDVKENNVNETLSPSLHSSSDAPVHILQRSFSGYAKVSV